MGKKQRLRFSEAEPRVNVEQGEGEVSVAQAEPQVNVEQAEGAEIEVEQADA